MDEVYAPFLDVVGDIGNIFWQLSTAHIKGEWDYTGINQARIEGQKKIQDATLEEYRTQTIMGPRVLTATLRSKLQEHDILALDNGLYKVWIARNYPCYHPNTLLLDNALATMGAGLASAMAAKMQNPDVRVVCVTGDGGLVMNLGDIETVVRLKLDITMIVLNNNSYGMIEWKQEGSGMKNWGLKFGNPDFVMLAESFGAHGIRVEKPEDFDGALEKAFALPGLKIIDLVFEYPREIY